MHCADSFCSSILVWLRCKGVVFFIMAGFYRQLSQLTIWSVRSVRNGGDVAPLTTCSLVGFLVGFQITNVASAVFARCLVMVEKSLGLTFTIFLERLKLWRPILNVLEGNQTGRLTPP